ncbi:MAG: Flp pilus assembly complex ATPase component TadA [Syntrophaceae bacterium]|nr:Flp pilus assembly complex ATPase component TadA [Syntrophaceae bacterium]
MRLTLNAAESGHLVIATLHATHAEDALYRLCNSFPLEAQEEIRHQVASTLQWLVVSILSSGRMSGSACRCCPSCAETSPSRNPPGKQVPQIESAIQMGKNDGMFTTERYAREYLAKVGSFASPQDIFKPSAESSQEEVYHSPLVEGGARGAPPVASPQKA